MKVKFSLKFNLKLKFYFKLNFKLNFKFNFIPIFGFIMVILNETNGAAIDYNSMEFSDFRKPCVVLQLVSQLVFFSINQVLFHLLWKKNLVRCLQVLWPWLQVLEMALIADGSFNSNKIYFVLFTRSIEIDIDH